MSFEKNERSCYAWRYKTANELFAYQEPCEKKTLRREDLILSKSAFIVKSVCGLKIQIACPDVFH